MSLPFFLSRIERNQKTQPDKILRGHTNKTKSSMEGGDEKMRWAERTVRLRATRWEAEPELSQSSRRGSL